MLTLITRCAQYIPKRYNPKYQYIHGVIQQATSASTGNSLSNIPTTFVASTAARLFLRKGDIEAVSAGNALILSPCQDVQPSEIYFSYSAKEKVTILICANWQYTNVREAAHQHRDSGVKSC